MKKNSHKADYAAKNAPTFCEIWFIHKGKHVWTKEASETVTISRTCLADELRTDDLRSKSSQYEKSECLYDVVNFRSRSSCQSIQRPDLKECNQNDGDLLLTSPGSPYDPKDAQSSISNNSSSKNSTEREVSFDTDFKLKEEKLYGQLLEAKAGVETSKDGAFLELLKRETLEAEAMKAMQKVNL